MPKILNIETATDICSVSFCEDGKVISFQENKEGYTHASTLTILIQKCLDEAGTTLDALDAVAVSQGPGSYTGLRIGVSVAKGICYALNKPLIAVDTLKAIAWACAQKMQENVLYCPMIDARRMEVYTSLFTLENEEKQPVNALIVDENSFQDFFTKGEKIIFCGNGAEKCKSVLTSPLANFSPLVCSAKHLSFLSNMYYLQGNFSDVGYFKPHYLKAVNVTIPKKIL